jgi:hypothetical protein
MPNRMIRESARTSPTLAKVSHGAERCFWRLTTLADDFGRFNAEPSVVRALCFPTMLEKVPQRHVAAWMDELRSAGLIRCYRVGDKHVAAFLTWDQHQRTRAEKSKFPDPPSSADICCQPLTSAAVRAGAGVVSEVVIENTEGEDVRHGPMAAPDSTRPPVVFKIPAPVSEALGRSPKLGAVARLRLPAWWQAVLRANPGVDLAAEVLKAEAYLVAHPERHYKRLDRFLHGWLGRADR